VARQAAARTPLPLSYCPLTKPELWAERAEVVEHQKGVFPRESLLAANVYQQDELRGVKRSDQELSRVNKVTPLLAHKKSSAALPCLP